MPRRISPVAYLALAVFAPGASADSEVIYPTIHKDAARCQLVVYGKVQRPPAPAAEDAAEIVVTEVLKQGAGRRLAPGSLLRLPDRWPSIPTQNALVLRSIEGGGWSEFRHVAGKQPLLDYARGLLSIRNAGNGRAAVLRYCLDYLENGERGVARDAWDAPIVRRGILRYALKCRDTEAARFVAERRKADPQRFADQEELLKLEAESRKPR